MSSRAQSASNLTGRIASTVTGWLIEGIDSLMQAAKAKARGYRSICNLKIIVCLLAGKLDLRLPRNVVSTTLNSEVPN